MDKTLPLKQLINNSKQLIESNQQLVQANNNYFELIEKMNQRQEKMLACFGRLYQYINSKNEKTWEEHNQIKELFELITYTQKEAEK
jgi:hypothetical protein